MIQDAADRLLTADRALAQAAVLNTVPLYEQAGRLAYYAMFHAAQALVVERGFAPAKTHRGLRQLFARCARNEQATVQALVAPLTNSYRLKWTADYDTAGTAVSAPEAAAALADATQFVAAIRTALSSTAP